MQIRCGVHLAVVVLVAGTISVRTAVSHSVPPRPCQPQNAAMQTLRARAASVLPPIEGSFCRRRSGRSSDRAASECETSAHPSPAHLQTHTLQTKPSPISTSLVSARMISLRVRVRVGWAVCRARVPAQDSVRGRSPAETPNPSPLYSLYPHFPSTTSLSHGVGRPRPTAQRGHPVPYDRIDHRRLCQSALPSLLAFSPSLTPTLSSVVLPTPGPR